MATTHSLIICGGDVRDKGMRCGKETTRRIEKALRFIIQFLKHHPEDHFFVILAAGKNPEEPTHPTLKGVMQRYLTIRLFEERIRNSVTVIAAREDAWYTKNELALALPIVRQKHSECFVVTSWYHMARVRFNLFSIDPKLTVHCVLAWSPQWWNIFFIFYKGFKLLFNKKRRNYRPVN